MQGKLEFHNLWHTGCTLTWNGLGIVLSFDLNLICKILVTTMNVYFPFSLGLFNQRNIILAINDLKPSNKQKFRPERVFDKPWLIESMK